MEMTVSIWSSSVSIRDILSLCFELEKNEVEGPASRSAITSLVISARKRPRIRLSCLMKTSRSRLGQQGR